MNAKTASRLMSAECFSDTNRFSPSVELPERSSLSSLTYGGWSSEPKLLPSACTTPLEPSAISTRQPRSRSIPPPPVAFASARLSIPPPVFCGGCWFQFRLIRTGPPAPPLVRLTCWPRLVSEIGPPAGAAAELGPALLEGRLL